MDCKTVMHKVKTSLYADEPAYRAIDFMIDNHMRAVPVVDRDGVFVGLLSTERLMHFLLPVPVSMMRGTKCVSYIRETPKELHRRLAEMGTHSVGGLVDPYAHVAYPDTGLIDVMIHLSEKQHVVPVVERNNNKLLGVITFYTIIEMLKESVK